MIIIFTLLTITYLAVGVWFVLWVFDYDLKGVKVSPIKLTIVTIAWLPIIVYDLVSYYKEFKKHRRHHNA